MITKEEQIAKQMAHQAAQFYKSAANQLEAAGFDGLEFAADLERHYRAAGNLEIANGLRDVLVRVGR